MQFNTKPKFKQIPISTKIALLFILFFSVCSRVVYLPFHRTDKDDIGVAITVLTHYNSFKATHFGNPAHARYESKLYQYMRKADSLGILKPIIQPFVVSWAWSYAPLQYVGMDLLINKNMSYREILFWGRLPTAVFGVVNIILMAFLLIQLYQKQLIHHHLIVIGTLLMALSHEHIIFSQVMLNYELGITAHLVFLILLLCHNQVNSYLMYGLIFLTPFMQYQAVFISVAWAGTVLLFEKPKIFTLSFIKKYSYLSLPILAFGILYIVFLRNLRDLGAWTWKNGLTNEYLFDYNKLTTDAISYPIQFFLQNSYDVYTAMLSCTNENTTSYYIQNVFLISWGLLGVFFLIKSSQETYQKIALYSVLLLLVWTFMVVSQKFTLSPTRHNIILLPIFILWIVVGINGLQQFITLYWFEKITPIITVCIIINFAVSYADFLENRKDKFDEKEFKNFLQEYQVKTVVCYGEATVGELLKALLPSDGINFIETYRNAMDYYNIDRGIYVRKVSAPTTHFIAYSQHLPLKTQANTIQQQYFPLLSSHNVQSCLYTKVPKLEDLFDSLPANYTYKIYPIKEVYSDTELEFSSKTKYGINGYFLYFVEVTSSVTAN